MDIKELLASLANFDEMEAEDGMNIAESEDLLDLNIIKASANLGTQDMIYMLLNIIGSYVPEKTLKTIKDQFTLALASQVNEEVTEEVVESTEVEEVTESTEEVNETKEFADDKVEYLFNVQVSGKAEDEMSNAFVKTEILRAIENALEAYDVTVNVENA